MVKLTEVQIKTAVDWWGEKIKSGGSKDNGFDSPQALLSSLLAAVNMEEQDDLKLVKFKSTLHSCLLEKDWRITLRTDYGPDGILRKCAEEAEIDELQFPWKTIMSFNHGGVQVVEGVNGSLKELELKEV